MILLLFIFSANVRASCSIFDVECQTSGALISLDSTCHAAMNSSDEIVNSNLTDLFLTISLENQTITSDCALSNHQVFEYSKCFSANAHAGTSLNYTSQIVKAVEVENFYVFVAVVEEILCEPAMNVQHDEKALLISSPSSNGAIPSYSPTASIKLSGGKTLGAFVTASIEAENDEFYSKEFGDCNVTSGELTVELLKNGEITSDGARLRAELESPDSLRFIRFSKRSDIATAFDVQCSIRWRSITASETTTTTATTPLSPSDTYIIVILGTLSDSFIINGDGTSISSVEISVPGNINDYTNSAKSAIVSDKLYLFGGNGVDTSSRKIARLDSCSFVELAVRLNVDFTWGHSTLSISNGSEALICFEPEDSSTSCDIFDGAAVAPTHSSNWQHRAAALGFYKGQPTVIGGQDRWWSAKVETKGETGWTQLTSFPYTLKGYNLVGLDNGDMLLIGGKKQDESMILPVWRLSNDIWSEEERLHKSFARGSTIKIENHMYSFGGLSSEHEEFPIQRIDLKEDNTIESFSVIGNHAQFYHYPILFKTERNSCTTS